MIPVTQTTLAVMSSVIGILDETLLYVQQATKMRVCYAQTPAGFTKFLTVSDVFIYSSL